MNILSNREKFKINYLKNTNIIYLLGAGRSGTTLLATVLNSHPEIHTIGEMHQFLEHILLSKNCSCGEELSTCEFWGPVIQQLNYSEVQLKADYILSLNKEKHINVPGLLLNRKADHPYLKIQEHIFNVVAKNNRKEYFLDSSKYIARYLLLKRSKTHNIKGIYVVRDVRGVINSFQKKVQTSRTPLSTIIYYTAVNFFGQLVCWIDKEVLKVKYEALIENPNESIKEIYNHCFNADNAVNAPLSTVSEYEMPHIIGGNRMKTNKAISIKKDEKWKESISRVNQVVYYILTFPFMLINKYKV